MKKITKEEKYFYLFLIINSVLWTCVQLLRTSLSIDAMEAVTWGELISFGTNKHPPLSGWLMAGFYNLCGQHDFAAYILGQICIFTGLVFIYKLAKFFMSKEKALCSSMILTCCYYYTYIVFIDNFNCNYLSMAIWPAIAYYFYKSIKENKLRDWIIFGITSGLGVLAKYQVPFLFIALFLYLLICDRKQFKQKGIYIAVLSGLIVILPHIMWLFKTNFFSFTYMTGRTEIGTHNTPKFLLAFARITFPVKFILDQILSVAGCIALYLILALHAKNISINKDKNNFSDKVFLFCITCIPALAQGLMGAITGNRVPGIWGSIMVSFVGIALFYFFPIKFNERSFKFFMKWIYILMGLWLTALSIFAFTQVKYPISYPHKQIMTDFDKIWSEKTNNSQLKYVGGGIDYIFQFRLYNKQHPTAVLETFGYKNPWADHNDILKSGMLILDNTPENTINRVKEMVVLLPDTYTPDEPQEYKFTVKSKFGRTKEYSFYYIIIPPMK